MKILHSCFLLLAVPSAAQSNMPTEVYGPVSAVQVYASLGTNITSTNEWEYEAARNAHITWGRFDCPWQAVEHQNLPQNSSGGYTFPAACESGLSFSRQYGIHPIVDALYGAPYGPVALATNMSDAPAGSYTITLHINSGSLSYVQPGQSYLKAETGDLSDKHAYAGTLITEKTQTSVTLASALTKMLPAGSPVVINLQMYSPVLLSPGTTFRKQPSIQAFGRYVHFLETQVAASGIQGRVSIWNEPPWAGDPWDAAANLYDTPPAEQRIKQDFGVELAYYAATLPPVNGVMLDNGYTNKTGNGSLFVPERRNLLPSLDALHKIFASESFHPYGNNPEDSAWLPGCIKTHTTPALYGHVFHDCTPVGMVTGSNIKWEAAINESSGSLTGLDLGITETGLARGGTSAATEEQITRFDLRQFLVFAGSNVHPILFYRLAGDPPYEWLHEDHSPYPVYMAFQNLMQTIGYIAHTPMSPFPQCALPTVHDYAGAYPLALTIFTGASDEGGKRSSLLLYTWQRTYSSGRWTALPSPSLTNLSLNIPPGLTVRTVRDTVGNTPVLYSLRGNTLTYPVADNPVEVLLTPANNVRTPPVLCGS